jgi:hypothetical protein
MMKPTAWPSFDRERLSPRWSTKELVMLHLAGCGSRIGEEQATCFQNLMDDKGRLIARIAPLALGEFGQCGSLRPIKRNDQLPKV